MTEEICRICLSTVDDKMKLNIFSGENKLVSSKIMFVAKVKVYPGDGLPTIICPRCLTMLNSCFDFINLCQVSDLQLRASVKNNLEETNIHNDYDDFLKIEQNLSDSTEMHESFTKNNVAKKKQSKSNIKKRGKKRQCSICGRVMSSTYRLKTHLVTHTDDRPFSCQHCGKRFSLPENLKVHLRIHTGEKPLHCSICGESFAQSSGLIAHRRKHSGQLPYKCKLCPRSFRTIGHFQYHTKRHTGEKKFECDTCSRRFITRGDLKQHIVTHTGYRPHICSICGLRLTRASNLKRHIQQLHSSLETTPPTLTKIGGASQTMGNNGLKENEKIIISSPVIL